MTFHCKINNSLESYWVINSQPARTTHQKDNLATQGFITEDRHKENVTMLTLKVNTTADKNGTELYCSFLPATSSSTAILLTITGKQK